VARSVQNVRAEVGMIRWTAFALVAEGCLGPCDAPASVPEHAVVAMPVEDFEAIVGAEGPVDEAVAAGCAKLCASVAEEREVEIVECSAEERDSRTWEVSCGYRVDGYCL
jgi:hypothetical protein